MKPVLAITMGDVNGVGPEILAKALANKSVWRVCDPLVVGDAAILDDARRHAPGCPPVAGVERPELAFFDGKRAVVWQAGVVAPARRPGVLDAQAGRAAVEWVMAAVRLVQSGGAGGVVTNPINKEGIHRAGYLYAGHTELIAEMTNSPDYRMCLFTGGAGHPMRVVHISSHCSLTDAIKAVRTPRIARSIEVGHEALERLGLPQGRIGVAALNPHAGEAGAFGDEEAREIAPAIEQCRARGIACSGPWPADTVFRKMREGELDLVVAMYHDQGHVPVKLVAMDEGVNVTLGISIVRTSVDHGTAYDIAGTGTAREASLVAAIELAARLAGGR